MNPADYEKNVLKTESVDFEGIKSRLSDPMLRLLHAGLGMSSELSEIEVAMDKQERDFVNLAEETADIYWYIAVAVNALGLDHEEVSFYELSVKENYILREAVNTSTWAVGEFNDQIKKHLFYGREFNREKVKQTLQQLCMALSAICTFCGKTPFEVRTTNINKLKARYGDKFTAEAALNRDLEVERKILEET